MPDEKAVQFDINAEINKFFDNSSLPEGGSPKFILIMGIPGAGKTTLRQDSFSKGYVIVDANEIYRNICKDQNYPYESYKDMVELLGGLIADKAVKEKRNIVMEVMCDSAEKAKLVIDAMKSVGYMVDLKFVHCDPVEAYKRHVNKVHEDKLYISCAFTHESHQRWILDAVKKNQSSVK